MALPDLWCYLKGYVIIAVKGRTLEKFVNTALARGIELWDITRVDDRSLVARAYLHDLPSLGRVLRETDCQARVEEKVGLPFVVRRLARRKGLAVGVVLFSVALYALSSFVWFVDVSGAEKTRPRAVLELVARYGLRPGVLKSSVEPATLARRILAEFPEVAWAAVHVRGTVAIVEIVEKTLPDEGHGVVDVVAAEDALVTNMIVLSGEPLVGEGDTVTRGQVLIAGVIVGQGAADEGREAREVVNARGIVLGRVWRTYSEKCPLVKQVVTETGRVARTRRIRVGGFAFVVGPKVSPFSDYEREERSYSVPPIAPAGRGLGLDVTTYREVTRRAELLNRDEILAEARARARASLEARLPKDAKVLDVMEDVKYSQGGVITYTMTMETAEDIARERRQEQGFERADRS